MRTHNIPSCYKKIKEILIMPSDLAHFSALIGSNYPCLKLILMVPKVFEPLKFDCTQPIYNMFDTFQKKKIVLIGRN